MKVLKFSNKGVTCRDMCMFTVSEGTRDIQVGFDGRVSFSNLPHYVTANEKYAISK